MRLIVAVGLVLALALPAAAQDKKASGKKMSPGQCRTMVMQNPMYTKQGGMTRAGAAAISRCMKGQPI